MCWWLQSNDIFFCMCEAKDELIGKAKQNSGPKLYGLNELAYKYGQEELFVFLCTVANIIQSN